MSTPPTQRSNKQRSDPNGSGSSQNEELISNVRRQSSIADTTSFNYRPHGMRVQHTNGSTSLRSAAQPPSEAAFTNSMHNTLINGHQYPYPQQGTSNAPTFVSRSSSTGMWPGQQANGWTPSISSNMGDITMNPLGGNAVLPGMTSTQTGFNNLRINPSLPTGLSYGNHAQAADDRVNLMSNSPFNMRVPTSSQSGGRSLYIPTTLEANPTPPTNIIRKRDTNLIFQQLMSRYLSQGNDILLHQENTSQPSDNSLRTCNGYQSIGSGNGAELQCKSNGKLPMYINDSSRFPTVEQNVQGLISSSKPVHIANVIPDDLSVKSTKQTKRRQSETNPADTKPAKRSSGRPPGKSSVNTSHQPKTQTYPNISILEIQIGQWEQKCKYKWDILAKCYTGRRQLLWEIMRPADKLKQRIAMRWDSIQSILISDTKLEVKLKEGTCPKFQCEKDVTAKLHSSWEGCDDFTGGEAKRNLKHTLVFEPNMLEKFKNELMECPKLRAIVTMSTNRAARNNLPLDLPMQIEESNLAMQVGHIPNIPDPIPFNTNVFTRIQGTKNSQDYKKLWDKGEGCSSSYARRSANKVPDDDSPMQDIQLVQSASLASYPINGNVNAQAHKKPWDNGEGCSSSYAQRSANKVPDDDSPMQDIQLVQSASVASDPINANTNDLNGMTQSQAVTDGWEFFSLENVYEYLEDISFDIPDTTQYELSD